MKKRIKIRKFSRTSNERKQLFRNLITSLVQYGFIETSEAKAKAIRPMVEKLVTMAKDNSLSSFRRLIQNTGSSEVAKGLQVVGQTFSSRPGGYVRLIRLGHRLGDDSSVVRIEWVEKITNPEIVTSVKKEIKKVDMPDKKVTVEAKPTKKIQKKVAKKV